MVCYMDMAFFIFIHILIATHFMGTNGIALMTRNAQIDGRIFSKRKGELSKERLHRNTACETEGILANANIHCLSYSMCRSTCVPGFRLPNGADHLDVHCIDGRWMTKLGTYEIPDCQRHHPEADGGDPFGYFWEGCTMAGTPANARTLCNSQDGCCATCFNGYTFLNGESELEVECEDGNWKSKSFTDSKKIPNCKRVDGQTKTSSVMKISKNKIFPVYSYDDMEQTGLEKTPVVLTGILKGTPVLITGVLQSQNISDTHADLLKITMESMNLTNHLPIPEEISKLHDHLTEQMNRKSSDSLRSENVHISSYSKKESANTNGKDALAALDALDTLDGDKISPSYQDELEIRTPFSMDVEDNSKQNSTDKSLNETALIANSSVMLNDDTSNIKEDYTDKSLNITTMIPNSSMMLNDDMSNIKEKYHSSLDEEYSDKAVKSKIKKDNSLERDEETKGRDTDIIYKYNSSERYYMDDKDDQNEELGTSIVDKDDNKDTSRSNEDDEENGYREESNFTEVTENNRDIDNGSTTETYERRDPRFGKQNPRKRNRNINNDNDKNKNNTHTHQARKRRVHVDIEGVQNSKTP